MERATLTFPTRQQAEHFATAWGRFTKTGHLLGSGMVDVKVTVHEVGEREKEWIDVYISRINKEYNPAK